MIINDNYNYDNDGDCEDYEDYYSDYDGDGDDYDEDVD